MKKKFCVGLFLIFLFQLQATIVLNKKNRVFLDLDFATGVGTGAIREHVFEEKSTLSRLDWKIKAVPIFRTRANLSFFGFFFSASFLAGLGIRAGQLDDWDFFKFTASGEQIITERASFFSTHELNIKRFLEGDFFFGHSFKIKKIFFSPILGIALRNTKFIGKNGYSQYTDQYDFSTFWSPDLKKTPITGNVINYEQSVFLPYLGAQFAFNFFKGFSFLIFAKVSPYSIVNGTDYHIARKTFFYDYMRGGFALFSGFDFRFKRIALEFSWERIKIFSGNTKQVEKNFTSYSFNSAGTDSNIFRVLIKFVL